MRMITHVITDSIMQTHNHISGKFCQYTIIANNPYILAQQNSPITAKSLRNKQLVKGICRIVLTALYIGAVMILSCFGYCMQEEQENYGIDWEGPVGVDVDTVEVPETAIPVGCSLSEIEALTHLLVVMSMGSTYT